MRRVPLFPSILLSFILVLGGFVLWDQSAPKRALDARERRWGTRITQGDVLFEDVDCGLRCDLIREVTHSPYSHVGMVLDENGERVVWEAFGPVGPTPLAEWLERSRDHKVALYRLDSSLLPSLPRIAEEIRSMRGRPYDGNYQWDDSRIYCSELVAKAVEKATGKQLFLPHPLGTGAFGSRSGLIYQMSKGQLTEQTPMVTPFDLTRSPLLHRVVNEFEP